MGWLREGECGSVRSPSENEPMCSGSDPLIEHPAQPDRIPTSTLSAPRRDTMRARSTRSFRPSSLPCPGSPPPTLIRPMQRSACPTGLAHNDPSKLSSAGQLTAFAVRRSSPTLTRRSHELRAADISRPGCPHPRIDSSCFCTAPQNGAAGWHPTPPDYLPAGSTHSARHAGASNVWAKYVSARQTLPSRTWPITRMYQSLPSG
jgi:hypothetical protein